MNQKLARFGLVVAVLAAFAVPTLTPKPAAAWWAHPGYGWHEGRYGGWHHGWGWRSGWHPGWGYGWRRPGIVVWNAPGFWIAPHWNGPYWVPGHWR